MQFQISIILIFLTTFSKANNNQEICATIQVSGNSQPVGLGWFHTHSNDNVKVIIFAPTLQLQMMELEFLEPLSVGNHTVCHEINGSPGSSVDELTYTLTNLLHMVAVQHQGGSDSVHFRLFIELDKCSAEYALYGPNGNNAEYNIPENYMGFWVGGQSSVVNHCQSEYSSAIGSCCPNGEICTTAFRDISCENNQEAVNCESVAEEILSFPEIMSKAQKHAKIALLKLAKRCEKTRHTAMKQQNLKSLSEFKKEVRTQKNLKTELRVTEKLQVRTDKKTARQQKKEAKIE